MESNNYYLGLPSSNLLIKQSPLKIIVCGTGEMAHWVSVVPCSSREPEVQFPPHTLDSSQLSVTSAAGAQTTSSGTYGGSVFTGYCQSLTIATTFFFSFKLREIPASHFSQNRWLLLCKIQCMNRVPLFFLGF